MIRRWLSIVTVLFLVLTHIPQYAYAGSIDTWTLRSPLPTGNPLTSVAYGNNTFVTVGGSGTILTSSDGATWTSRVSGTANILNRVIYGNAMFVTVGAGGTILTSSDGVSWTSRASGLTTNIAGITYGNGLYVAVGNSGKIVTSTNGVNWTSRASGTSSTLYDVAYGQDVYVAVGSGVIITSSNGVNWTSQTGGSSYLLTDVAFGDGRFVALGGDNRTIFSNDGGVTWRTSGTNYSTAYGISFDNGHFAAVGANGAILTSSDGVSWADQSSGTTITLTSVTNGNGTYVAVGETTILSSPDGASWTSRMNGTTSSLLGVIYANGMYWAVAEGGTIVVSSDGVSWTSRASSTTKVLYGIAYGDGKYAAVGQSGTITTSADGVSWTNRTSGTSNHLYSVVYGNGLFVAAGQGGMILTSSDGVTWVSRTSGASYDLNGVTYGNGGFAAVGGGGTIVTSTDGINWTNRTSGITNMLKGIAFGNSTYVAVGMNGQIITSGDGVSWQSQTSGLTTQLNGIAFGNGMFEAVGNSGTILTSGNGASWTSRASGTTMALFGFAFGTDTYVAVGSKGTIVQSDPIAPAIISVSVRPNSASVVQGESKQLAAAVEVVDGAATTVDWTSGDVSEKVAVDSTGNVTVAADAVPGDYTITATSTVDGSKKGTATITVIAATVPEATPAAAIDYAAEQLTGLVPGGAYTVNGTTVTADGDGKAAIDGGWLGLAVDVVKKGNGTTTTDSPAQTLSLPARPAALTAGKTDETSIGGNNGTLTNVTSAMEYKKAAGSWTDVAGTSVTGLAPGTYSVRVKATSSSFASEAQTVTIAAFVASPEATPVAEIDYAAEQLTGLVPGGAYTVNGTAVTADGSGKAAIDGGWLGLAVDVVKKGNGTTTTDSPAQTLSLPARPAAPTAGKTDETSINGNDGTLTNVTSAMAYKKAAGSWTDVAGTSVTGLAPDTYSVRVKATSSSFASEAQTVTIAAFVASPEATPAAEIDYAAEQLTGLVPGGAYTVNGTTVMADGSGKAAIDGGWLGLAVDVVKKGNGTTTTDSPAQTLSLPARPATPTAGKTAETSINGNNGTLTNVTTAMEYKKAAGSWTDIAGTSVTGLTPGTYSVRVKATSSSFASEAQTLTIAAFVASPEATPAAAIDYAAEQLTGLVPGGAYTVNGTTVTADGSGKAAIDGSWLGLAVDVVKKGDGTTTTDSPAQTLSLPARLAAPVEISVTDTTYNGANDGSILGVNPAMEFKEGETGTWTNAAGTSVVGLTPGVYYVRVAATESSFASLSAQVTIHDSDATVPTAPNVSTDDENNVIVGLDTTMEFSVDDAVYARYDGTNMPQLSGEHTVQVRVAASGSVPAGPSTELIFTTNVPIPAGGLTVTATDPSGAANDGRTGISVAPAADDNHRMVYVNFGSGTVDVPNVGDTLSGYLNVPSDYMIPAANGDKIGVAEVDAQGKVVKFGQTAAIVIAEQTAPPPSNEEVSTGTIGPKEESVEVLVNGKVENAGKATTTEAGGVKTTTIAVDSAKLQSKLDAEGMNAVVTIPVKTASDVVIGELNGQMVKNMENLSATLVLQSDKGTYTLPAQEINIDDLAGKFGSDVKLEDIQLKITVAQTPETMASVVESAASKGEFSIVAPAVDFTVTGAYRGDTVEVTTFNAYVERRVALPDGTDPNRITTGVVVEADGTVRHVPTQIVLVEGKYYAIINSLTNSTYAVVWHPLEFADVANHWAKDAVNNMGSRMVMEGIGGGLFSPDRDITRAEFAAIVVRGLGLRLDNGATPFSDVKATDWYSSAVNTAYSYNLIAGFKDGTFRPNDRITREQAMVVLSNAMKVTGLQDKLAIQSSDAALRPFGDAASVSAWAQGGVADSVQAGIVAGRSGALLAPKANMTRAEVAMIIQNLLQKSGLI